jgi:hypothetical protein
MIHPLNHNQSINYICYDRHDNVMGIIHLMQSTTNFFSNIICTFIEQSAEYRIIDRADDSSISLWEMGLTIVRTNKRNEWPTHDHAGNGEWRKESERRLWLASACRCNEYPHVTNVIYRGTCDIQ